MPLTNIQIRNAKPKDKAYKLFDAKGLFLYVPSSGSKAWRMKYYFNRVEKLIVLGHYPQLSLAEAREKQLEVKKLIAQGIDPTVQKQIEKIKAAQAQADNLEAVAREWAAKFGTNKEEKTNQRNLRMLELHIFPALGHRPISGITAQELLVLLQRCEKRGNIETARKIRSVCERVFGYALASMRCERNIAVDIKNALAPRKTKHMAAIIDVVKFGQLLRDIWDYEGRYITKIALRLCALFGLRPGELRNLEWSEVDLDNALISIQMGRMKKRRPHYVPLSNQALELLRELKEHTGHKKYCFASLQGNKGMSENTLNAALRRLGYDTQEEHTSHGFRSTFSTMAHGSGMWRREVVEIQLAHKHGSSVELIYDRGDYLQERRELMQWWSNECDKMRNGATVITLRA